MPKRKVKPKRELVLKTTQIGNTTYCGSDENILRHKPAHERRRAGHYPGIVCLAHIPEFRGWKECYKIGKVEDTEILPEA